jgi:ATP-binding cassette subfamily F protein uup
MRDERKQRRERSGTANMQLSEQERSGKMVIEADNIQYNYAQQPIVSGLCTTIMRGDKIGIIGPNGVGKTTLIRLLLGQLQPDSGSVKLGTKLDIAYFDQHRSDLDDSKSVRDNLAEGTDKIELNGQSKHVIGYLSDFLFSPQRANSPVSTLSGGERNRLMLAKLFSRPFNLLVMDEPTNDLDVETLELLEELLLNYQGTLLLVSHDRAFLNNVVTSTLVFEGNGRVSEYVGGYDDWLRQASASAGKQNKEATSIKKPRAQAGQKKPAKLSYRDQRELDSLPQKIEQLEASLQQLHADMGDASFYHQDKNVIAETRDKLERLDQELAAAYERWEQLDAMLAAVD